MAGIHANPVKQKFANVRHQERSHKPVENLTQKVFFVLVKPELSYSHQANPIEPPIFAPVIPNKMELASEYNLPTGWRLVQIGWRGLTWANGW